MSAGSDNSAATRRIFSGIQPTGRKHLGNYIGAIRQYVIGQDQLDAGAGEDAIYCIVDLHAITVAYDPAELRERVYDTTATLLAAGLDPDRCVLFRQGDVREHTELTWLLGAVTAWGDLNRMHQWKTKREQAESQSGAFVSAGLFNYPILMAADVLAYRATEVPVGDDQRQHVELMREVARRFNERFGPTLTVPEHRIPGRRRPDHGPAGSDEQDVDDERRGGRKGLRARRAGPDPQEVPQRRHRLGARGQACRAE